MVETQSPPTTSEVIKPIVEKASVPLTVAGGILLFIFILGSVTGYMIASFGSQSGKSGSTKTAVEVVQSDTKAGIIDKKTFTDTATGVLREGGLEGEGNFHLERGAKDQTAYLTSSTADLSMYVGKKVQVWGQTYAGEKTGWLMDVGYIEVVK